MNGEGADFEAFMKTREKAARAYVAGDDKEVVALSTASPPATFFGPMGGAVVGAQEVAARYQSDVAAFQPGGETHFEVLHASASEGLGYWTGYQHAKARLGEKGEVVQMKLRITEIFRREKGTWKMIHRHADRLSDASPPKG